jgi:hypothetical protein
MTAIRIASVSRPQDRHLQQQNRNCESKNFSGGVEPVGPLLDSLKGVPWESHVSKSAKRGAPADSVLREHVERHVAG